MWSINVELPDRLDLSVGIEKVQQGLWVTFRLVHTNGHSSSPLPRTFIVVNTVLFSPFGSGGIAVLVLSIWDARYDNYTTTRDPQFLALLYQLCRLVQGPFRMS